MKRILESAQHIPSEGAPPAVLSRNLYAVHLRHGAPMPRPRRYARIDRAVPGVLRWSMLHGKVGDVFELSHAVTGMQIGTIKVRARGRVDVQYVWGE